MCPLKGYNAQTGEWNDSLLGDYLWSSTNFGEAITEVMTPLTWSVIQFTLDDWVYVPGIATVGNICGYPYVNISVFMPVFQILRKNRKELLTALEGTLYLNLPEGMEIPGIERFTWNTFSLFRQLLRIQSKQKSGLRRLPTYLAGNPAWFHQMREKITGVQSKFDLISLWHDEIKPHIKQGVWTVLGIVTSSSEYTIRLQRELRGLIGQEKANALIGNVSEHSNLIQSLDFMVGLTKVAQGDVTVEAFLEQYGHRGPHEFELSVPRPVEDFEWLERQIERFKASPVDIPGLLAKQKESHNAAWEVFCSQYPRKAASMHRRLEKSARYTRLREQARTEYVRDRWLIRLFALKASELLGFREDVFYLTLNEVLGSLAGDQSAISYIALREQLYQHYKTLPRYPPIIRGRFDAFQWAVDPERRSDIYEGHVTLKGEKHPGPLKGYPGSAGQAEGIARVIMHPREGDNLRDGEILVAVQTDISWTLLFPRAAAVVTDVGAPLSHAAIVARELGIPAVVGCGNATMLLKTGDRIRVDGGRGIVELI